MMTWLELDSKGGIVRRFGDGSFKEIASLGVAESCEGGDGNFAVTSGLKIPSAGSGRAKDQKAPGMLETWRGWKANFALMGYDEEKSKRMASRACDYTPSMEDLADELRAMPDTKKDYWRATYRRFRYDEGRDEAASILMANTFTGFDGSALVV